MDYNASTLFQFLMTGLGAGCIYGLVGIGFAVIFNVSGIINFGQGVFVMLGGMFCYAAHQLYGFNLLASAIMAIFGVALIGLLMEFAVIRPLWHRRAPLF